MLLYALIIHSDIAIQQNSFVNRMLTIKKQLTNLQGIVSFVTAVLDGVATLEVAALIYL